MARVGDFSPPHGAADASFASAVAACCGTKPLRILDAGCGRATIGPTLRARGHHYTPCDVQVLADGVIQADLAALPFGNASFDLALCRSVLQYVAEPRRALSELRRVLRSQALLVGAVAYLEPWIWGSRNHFSPAGLDDLLASEGFRLTRLWTGWTVAEAVAEAFSQLGRPLSPADSTLDAALDSLDEVDRLAFAASLNFVASSQSE